MATATKAATTTTPRARATRTTKATPKTTATPSAADTEVKAEQQTTADRFVVELEYERDTKRYAKFNIPASLEGTMAGSIYAPLGTDTVKVAIMGVAGDSSDEE